MCSLHLRRYRTALLTTFFLLPGCSSDRGAAADVLLLDTVVPVSTLNTAHTVTLHAQHRGYRLVEVGQEGVNARIEVTDTTGRLQFYDAPARRAAGPEYACWFDNAGAFMVRITTKDRVNAPSRLVRVRVREVAASRRSAAPAAVIAECQEAVGAQVDEKGNTLQVTLAAAAYQNAARTWNRLNQPARAANARLNAAWLATRNTTQWVRAFKWGEAARALYAANQDLIGAALASLQISVARFELARRDIADTGEFLPREKTYTLIEADLKAAIAIFDAAGYEYFSASARSTLGSNYYYWGDFDNSIRALDEAVVRFRAAGEGEGTAIALGNRAVVYRAAGRYAEAVETFKLLQSEGDALASEQTTADILNNSAATHLAAGNYDTALLQFLEALGKHDDSDDNGGITRSMNGVAETYLRLGDAGMAGDYAARARTWSSGGDDEIVSLLIEGEAQRARGDAQSALRTHAKARGAASSEALQARAALDLVSDALAIGDVGQARHWIAEAAKYRKPARNLFGLRSELQQARVDLLAKNYSLAENRLSQMRGMFEAIGAPAQEVEVLQELARAQFALGARAAALETNEQCLERFGKLRLSITSPNLRARLMATRRDAYELRVALLLAERQSATDVPRRAQLLRQALRASDEAQSGLVGTVGAEGGFMAKDSRADARSKLLGEIALREHALTAMEFGAPGSTDEMRAELARLRSDYDTMQVRNEADERIEDADYLPSSLRADTAVVVFLRAMDQVHRVVITREGIDERAIASPGEIEKTEREATLEIYESNAPNGGALAKLRRLLLEGAEAIETKRRWIVVTDSSSARVPFASLSVANDGRPVIAIHDLSMAVTTRDALALARADDSALRANLTQVALIFNPVFTPNDVRVEKRIKGANRFKSFVQLEGTTKEAAGIARQLRKDMAPLEVSGFDATRERVLKPDIQRAGVLHFATHAVASDQLSSGSGLLLTGTTKEGELLNGYLSTLDLLANRLEAGLVVLSACDTAVGETSGSENVAGLARAFLGGGARRVVATRWKVDDDATAMLMEEFYKNQVAGESTARALGRAQAALLSDPRGPRTWAAFVLYERAPRTRRSQKMP